MGLTSPATCPGVLSTIYVQLEVPWPIRSHILGFQPGRAASWSLLNQTSASNEDPQFGGLTSPDTSPGALSTKLRSRGRSGATFGVGTQQSCTAGASSTIPNPTRSPRPIRVPPGGHPTAWAFRSRAERCHGRGRIRGEGGGSRFLLRPQIKTRGWRWQEEDAPAAAALHQFGWSLPSPWPRGLTPAPGRNVGPQGRGGDIGRGWGVPGVP